MKSTKKLISVVTPCFNEEGNVDRCYTELKKVFERYLPQYNYEHIFCDNGSKDNTVKKLKIIAAKDKNVKVIVHSRNFGAYNSIYNGTISATGDAIVPAFSADCQDPAKIIPKFVKNWEAGSDVVFGRKKSRDESMLMQSMRRFYYKLVSNFANIDIPENVGEFSLIDKKVQDSLKEYKDYYPYLRGMIASCGFKTSTVDYDWVKRLVGKSTGSTFILIDNAINGLISFTNLPMRICMMLGFSISILSLIYSLISIVVAVFDDGAVQPGISLIIISLFFFFGLILFFIGVLGEYVSAIHFQVRKRPLVIEAERINF